MIELNAMEVEGYSNFHPHRQLRTHWRDHPLIKSARELIKEELADIFREKRNCVYLSEVPILVNLLEEQLFIEAASVEEYLNQDTLDKRLEILITKLINNEMESMEMPKDCWKSEELHTVGYGFTSTSYNYEPVITHNAHQAGFSGGSILSTYNEGYTNQFAASDASYMLSSTTRDSSFAGYSNQDGHCCPVSMDHQQHNTEASFGRRLSRQYPDPGGLDLTTHGVCVGRNSNDLATDFQSRQNLGTNSSKFHFSHQAHQSFPESSGMYSHPRTIDNAACGAESRLPFHLQRESLLDLGQLSCQSYMKFDASYASLSNCSSVEYVISGGITPECAYQCPVMQQPVNIIPESSVLALRSNEACMTNLYQYSCDDMKRLSSKRQKFDSSTYNCLSECWIPSLLDSSTAHNPGYAELRVAEDPMWIGSDLMGLNAEPVLYSTESLTRSNKNSDDTADTSKTLRSEILPKVSVFANNECSVENNTLGDALSALTYEFAEPTSDCTHILSEELAVGKKAQEKAVNQVIVEKLQMKPESISPEPDHEVINTENPEIRCVSLVDSFTAKQLNEHLSSLKYRTGQDLGKDICQLCASDSLQQAPIPVYCSSCGKVVKEGAQFYCKPGDTQYCFCATCVSYCRGVIELKGLVIPKAELEKRLNVSDKYESWVLCDRCEGWQHQICALYNCKRDKDKKASYICPVCLLKERETRKLVPVPKDKFLGAKDLPTTKLSDHIEKRLFMCLKQEREERAKAAGKNVDEVPEAANLIVRVVLSIDRQLKVKEQIRNIFHDLAYPTELPYRSKVILLFQEIDGVEVCLYAMYVQEFGSECDHPNNRCIYISYLDSVKYFKPEIKTVTGEALRTFVYHELLIGYLDYCKQRGFATCYIWACPPSKGDDYILFSHPETQKIPRCDKLQHWYQSMLKKAVREKVVVDVTNLYDYFFVHSVQGSIKETAARLPWFDGDIWPGEEVLKDIEEQTGKTSQKKVNKSHSYTKRNSRTKGQKGQSEEEETEKKSQKKVNKSYSYTKRNSRTKGQKGQNEDSVSTAKDVFLMEKLEHEILRHKDMSIVIHLQYFCRKCHKIISSRTRWSCNHCKNYQLCERCHDADKIIGETNKHTVHKSKEKHALTKVVANKLPSHTEDNDTMIDNKFLENRHTFLSFCIEEHYQFNTLRRAKHASMMILHHLHNPSELTSGTSFVE